MDTQTADSEVKATRTVGKVAQKQKHALSSNFKQAEFYYPHMAYTMEVGHKVEDALKPEYWASVAHKLAARELQGGLDRAGAVIELRSEDHSIYAELYVRAVHPAGLDVALLNSTPIGTQKTSKSEAFEERWNPGHKGWDVVRRSDSVVVSSGKDHKTKESALEFIKTMN